jgi:hypothetical protein
MTGLLPLDAYVSVVFTAALVDVLTPDRYPTVHAYAQLVGAVSVPVSFAAWLYGIASIAWACLA